jgi:hypothetical protein
MRCGGLAVVAQPRQPRQDRLTTNGMVHSAHSAQAEPSGVHLNMISSSPMGSPPEAALAIARMGDGENDAEVPQPRTAVESHLLRRAISDPRAACSLHCQSKGLPPPERRMREIRKRVRSRALLPRVPSQHYLLTPARPSCQIIPPRNVSLLLRPKPPLLRPIDSRES